MRRMSKLIVISVGLVAAAIVAPDIRVSIGASAPGAAMAPGPAGLLALQWGGQGRVEAPAGLRPDGSFDVDGARFQGRFVIFSLEGADGSIFGDDVSLFDADCVTQFGRGPQCAHFVAVVNGFVLEGFDTSSAGLVGQLQARTTVKERYRVFFDPKPDCTRDFDDPASFQTGEMIARYKLREFGSFDFKAGVFNSRGNYELIDSQPFTFNGVTLDFKDIAPRLTQIAHGRNPEPDPQPEPIPTDEEPFGVKGPGVFHLRFPISGLLMTAR